MATKREVSKVLVVIAVSFPTFTLTEETTDIYARLLADLPADVLEAAAIQCITTCKFFPTIAELRDAAFGMTTDRRSLPTAGEAWGEVRQQVYAGERARFSHPLIRKAIDCMGGITAYGASDVDDEPSWRARFMQIYDTLVRRAEDDAKTHPEVRTVMQQLAESRRVKQLGAEQADSQKQLTTGKAGRGGLYVIDYAKAVGE